MALLTKDAAAAQIHVSFMGKLLTPDALTERIRGTKWTHVVAFRPTGKHACISAWDWFWEASNFHCQSLWLLSFHHVLPTRVIVWDQDHSYQSSSSLC